MKILQIHNLYKFRGGEDYVVQNEKELLTQNGIEVIQYIRDSREIEDFSFWEKIDSAINLFYSKKTYNEVEEIIRKERPDVCHIHNWIPLISPSIFDVCKKYEIPVIQTLHSYRYNCLKSSFYRDEKICFECVNKKNFNPAVKYKCYRNSYIQSFLIGKLLKNYFPEILNKVDVFICPSNFIKNLCEELGFPSAKLKLKYNFLNNDPGEGENFEDYFLFSGRFEERKGARILLKSFENLSSNKLVVLGERIFKESTSSKNMMFKDFIALRKEIYDYYKNSYLVVFPSVWYEVMPMTIIEAFACGKPVIASRLGAMEEMIEDGKTGLLFEPGNVDNLKNKIEWASKHPDEIIQMGKNARHEFLVKYTADKNISILKNIYNLAINRQL